MANDWFIAVDKLRQIFEAPSRGTVFGEQGRPIARLPDALGGDKKQWYLLAAPAKGKEGFFALLRAKAHFLMLPMRIVDFLSESSRVSFSEGTPIPGAAADTRPQESFFTGTTVELRIPGAADGLVWAGHDLGREPLVSQGGYFILDSIYHEMTHGLIWLRAYADANIKKLVEDGIKAYTPTFGVSGDQFPPSSSFEEAAAAYVGDRIRRWCTAVSFVNSVLLTPSLSRDGIRVNRDYITDLYDKFVPAYGAVNLGIPGRAIEQIKKPDLSPELRGAINEKILDGLPLTKPFADTPLARLLN